MRRGTKLLLLLLLLAFAVSGYCFAVRHDWEDEAPEPTEDAVLTLSAHAEAELTKISWQYEGENNTLVQKDGVWSDPEDSALPVDQDIAVRMASAAARVKSTRALGGGQDPADYGLSRPVLTVEASFSDGSSALYELGDTNDLSGERYLAFRNGIYTVDETLYNAFSRTRWELIRAEKIPMLTNLTSVELSAAGRMLELIREEGSSRAYCGEVVWFCKSEDGMPAADTNAVEMYVSSLTELPTDDIAAYNATDGELALWGLGETADTLTVRYLENGSTRAFRLRFGAEEDGTRCFSMDSSRMVYRLPAELTEAIVSVDYDVRFRPKDVCRIAIGDLTGLTVSLDGEEHTIAVDAAAEDGTDTEENAEQRFSENGTTLNAASVQSALAAIYSLRAESNEGEIGKAGEELLHVTYYRDAGEYSEMPLILYAYGEDSVLVSFNGRTDQLCRRSAADTIMDLFRTALTPQEMP